MTTSKLREMFEVAVREDGRLPISDFIELTNKVPCTFTVDKKGENYYYYIPLSSMTNLDDDTVYNLATSGWILSEDRKNIVKYC